MEKEGSPLLEAALEYHKRGWSIIPISIVRKLDMKKGKLQYEKRPLVPWREYQQRRPNKEQIVEWWDEEYPNAGIGLITGRVSGIIAVDVDTEKGEEYLKHM